jgi:asparagine synthase (glutamine-hydrolysing)
MTSVFRFGANEKDWIYGPFLRDQLQTADAEASIAEPFNAAATADNLHRMLYADILTRLPEHTLLLTDRLSMAHGLEMRAPLLDHKLAEFCMTMPADLKIRRGVTKYAMRQAARKLLPDEIVDRRKQGFMFPVAYWMNSKALKDIRRSLLHGPLVNDGWVKASGVERLISEHQQHRADHHVRIWMLLNLDTWFRIYVERQQFQVRSSRLEIQEHAEVKV